MTKKRSSRKPAVDTRIINSFGAVMDDSIKFYHFSNSFKRWADKYSCSNNEVLQANH